MLTDKQRGLNNLRINGLIPTLQEICREWIKTCNEVGIYPLITSTRRTMVEQDGLYQQGRATHGQVVTKARAGFSWHNYGRAFDFVPVVDGEPDWNDLDKFERAGQIGKNLGMKWGGDFKSMVDRPHLEYHPGIDDIKDMIAKVLIDTEVRHGDIG